MVSVNSVVQPLLEEKPKAEKEGQLHDFLISNSYIAGSEPLKSEALVLEFYKKNGNNLIWIGQNGISPMGDTLLSVIKESFEDGLDSSQYHVAAIQAISKGLVKYKGYTGLSNEMAVLDMLLTDAFFTYAAQQYAGCIHTASYNTEWEEHLKSVSIPDSLQKTIATGQIRKMLNQFACKQPGYIALGRVLRQYINIKHSGTWIILPEDVRLKKGNRGEQVALLYKCLAVMGDIPDSHYRNDSVFGDTMEQAIKKYQRRHGLADDGIVSKRVAKELNKDIDERIEQIRMNMERWRWLPHYMPQPYILVNIAGFTLLVIDSSKQMMGMKVIAGKTDKRTPLFKARVTYIVLNPWWEIPEGIAKKEMLPVMKKDKNYLAKNNIKVYAGWQADAKEVSPSSINWDSVPASGLAYRLRQVPGSRNSLGHILFMFPNKYNVYMHDTPNKYLFSSSVRAYSHGCIRIQDPLDLAQFLLANNKGWTKDSILKITSSDKQAVTIVLNTPVDVYINYWTAWASDDGQVYFAPDIYNYDASLKAALLNHPQFRGDTKIKN